MLLMVQHAVPMPDPGSKMVPNWLFDALGYIDIPMVWVQKKGRICQLIFG